MKSLHLFQQPGYPPFRYNIGASFVQDVWAGHPSVTAGISGVFMKPSGFIKAQTAEDVTYITNKWYLSVDINSVRAAIPVDDSWVYQWVLNLP